MTFENYKYKHKYMKRVFLFIALSTMFFSCKEGTVNFSQSEINAEYKSKIVNMEIKSNTSWELKAECTPFFKLTKTKGKKDANITLNIEMNNTPKKRTCSIEAKTKKGNLSYLTIKQDPLPLFGAWKTSFVVSGTTWYKTITFQTDYIMEYYSHTDTQPGGFGQSEFSVDDEFIYSKNSSDPYRFSDNNTKLILGSSGNEKIYTRIN